MSASFGVAAVAALAGLVFTGLVIHRCVRTPRLDLAALSAATLALAVALVAMALGFGHGFGPTTFRAVHLGAQLLAPMALAWALAELAGQGPGGRFAARLGLAALTLVGTVVLATDPLAGTAFSRAWPAAASYYQFIPIAALDLSAAVTALAVVVAVIVAGVRARRYPGWQDLFPAVVLAAAAALVTEVLRLSLPVNSGYPALCLAAAGLAWLAARYAGRVRLDVLREGGPVWDASTGEFLDYDAGTGEFARYPGTGSEDGYSRNGSYRGEPRYPDEVSDASDPGYPAWAGDDTGDFGPGGEPPDFPGWFRDGPAGSPGPDGDPESAPGYGGRAPWGGPGQAPENGYGVFHTGDVLPVAGTGEQPWAGAYPDGGDGEPSALFGQIAIYTLQEGRAEEFDELAQQVVDQVRGNEPGTLVYAMHGVPSAPMQRILYEVYRDEDAFNEHLRQPYMQRFEEERKPCVLATNVIELGIRHAKFAPGTVPGRAARYGPASGQPRFGGGGAVPGGRERGPGLAGDRGGWPAGDGRPAGQGGGW
jgi:quinol monooxygenase YgiN